LDPPAGYVPDALRQLVLLKDCANGIQVELGCHVEHRGVFVVKTAMRFGVVVIALDQLEKVVVVGLQVSSRIHGDKTRILQESWIDETPRTRIPRRNAVYEVALEPLVRLGGCQAIDLRG